MLTALERKFRKVVPEELELLPTVKYPEEKLMELDELLREAKEQLNSGELIPMTADELAAELGIDLTEDVCYA